MYEIQLARDELHKKLGGGIPEKSLIAIEGGKGSGKSVLCQRLVYGLLQNAHTATYVSTQLTTAEFLNQMHSLNYPVSRNLIDGSLLYIPVYPLISEHIKKEGFIDKILNAKPFYEKDIIVFDSLSSLIANDVDSENVYDMLSFFKRITGISKTIIITINPDELERDVMHAIRFASTAIFESEIKPFGGDLKNIIKIIKYNLAPHNYQKIIVFRIEPRIGMVVEITSVA